MLEKATPERLSMFSDGVFAVLITVLVLELHPPEHPTYHALLLLWPTWLSYAVSYLFIAIVWMNHHYLLRFASEVTSRLLWFNFARELVDRAPAQKLSRKRRRSMRIRSLATLCLFGLAAIVALFAPLAGFGICICCLLVYLRPDPPGVGA